MNIFLVWLLTFGALCPVVRAGIAAASTQAQRLVMAEYKPATCAYCQSDTWCETRRNGKPQCRACKIERFYEHVLYAPFPNYRLQGWGRKILRDLYGTL